MTPQALTFLHTRSQLEIWHNLQKHGAGARWNIADMVRLGDLIAPETLSATIKQTVMEDQFLCADFHELNGEITQLAREVQSSRVGQAPPAGSGPEKDRRKSITTPAVGVHNSVASES